MVLLLLLMKLLLLPLPGALEIPILAEALHKAMEAMLMLTLRA